MNARTDPQHPSPNPNPVGSRPSSPEDQLDHARALGLQYDIASSSLRRMLTFNARHAELAWQRRRRDPIAGYALALLFAVPTGRPARSRDTMMLNGDDWVGGVEVAAASRVWLAGPESADLPDMLYRLECQVTDQRDTDGWVLREQLTTSLDDTLSEDAFWVGVGVSSLDTATGTWAQTGDQALSHAHVPGTIRLLLNVGATPIPDLALLVGERRGIGEYNARTIHSSHRMSSFDINAPYPYALVGVEQLLANPWHETVLRRMHGLFGALHTSRHFARPLGRPPKGSLWRGALEQPKGRQS